MHAYSVGMHHQEFIIFYILFISDNLGHFDIVNIYLGIPHSIQYGCNTVYFFNILYFNLGLMDCYPHLYDISLT